MRKLSTDKRTAIIAALVEGNSIASTCRMLAVNKRTVLRLLEDVGTLCRDHHELYVNDLDVRRAQVDEVWSYCHAKAKNLPSDKQDCYGFGDVWTWVCIDADTKLVIGYLVGLRNAECASDFLCDVSMRIKGRIQLTSDGLRLYVNAVEDAFGGDVDFAMLVKLYGTDPQAETRYSPPECIGCHSAAMVGSPDPKHVSTSFIERSNLTLRMGSRRFTRLTNAFSKKIENHEHAISLHYWHYNWVRRHQTIKTTPAVAARVADHVWTVRELVELLEQEEARFGGGGRIPKG